MVECLEAEQREKEEKATCTRKANEQMRWRTKQRKNTGTKKKEGASKKREREGET